MSISPVTDPESAQPERGVRVAEAYVLVATSDGNRFLKRFSRRVGEPANEDVRELEGRDAHYDAFVQARLRWDRAVPTIILISA